MPRVTDVRVPLALVPVAEEPRRCRTVWVPLPSPPATAARSSPGSSSSVVAVAGSLRRPVLGKLFAQAGATSGACPASGSSRDASYITTRVAVFQPLCRAVPQPHFKFVMAANSAGRLLLRRHCVTNDPTDCQESVADGRICSRSACRPLLRAGRGSGPLGVPAHRARGPAAAHASAACARNRPRPFSRRSLVTAKS